MLSTGHHLSNSIIFQNSRKFQKILNITTCPLLPVCKKKLWKFSSFPIAFPQGFLKNKIPSWGQATHGRSHASTKTPPTNPSALPGTSDIFTAFFCIGTSDVTVDFELSIWLEEVRSLLETLEVLTRSKKNKNMHNNIVYICICILFICCQQIYSVRYKLTSH